ncbi:MAG: hypothetical protein L0Y72_30570 [Gemmataceae bacterium]|nr:hypothetical protein [Gemmataceae bacterium]MCI0743392.1 hypothetical protein [Gemmataceae bacterium]
MRKFILAALMAASALMFTAQSANADFKVRFSTTGTGGTFTVVTDPDNDGVIQTSFSDPVNGVNITIVGALSDPAIGPAVLQLSVDGSTSAAASIVVDVTDTDYSFAPSPPGSLTISYTGSNDNGSLSGQAWASSSNAEFTIPPGVPAGTVTTGAQPAGTLNFSVPFLGSNPFSMSGRIIITTEGSAVFSTDLTLSVRPIPVPAAFVLLASGLPMGGLMYLRRRKAKAQTA